MEEGINDIDDFDDVIEDYEPQQELGDESQEQQQEDSSDESLISNILRNQGIDDLSRIKFEDEEGNIQERSWNQLTLEEKYNILSSNNSNPEFDLDDQEIELLNLVRSSNLTPSEYMQNFSKRSVENYLQNVQAQQTYDYSVDQYSDDELFVTDLLTKTENITDEEAIDILTKSKDNPTLYQKQINSLRNEYRQAELERVQQQQQQQQAYQQEIYQRFSNDVANAIEDLNEVSGYELNLDSDDKTEIFEFLTGFDSAGNSWLGKALNDPRTLARIGNFLLNEERIINDITSYYNNEIAQVRQNSYKKGYEDAQNKSQFVYKPLDSKTQFISDDLDEV